ncbi:uncharacterized protein V1478_013035 [Vespula squamosa]|uniref:CHK kinase-like domain-containing protein n=1 Tax=Vespula squamosa TaxID=30214 RepID=A0ABD2AC97_VESSQ
MCDEMATETPSWLNLEFVEKIMRKSKNDDSICVLNIFIKPATAKGDNYTSDMYRVLIEISCKRGNQEVKKKKSLIIKVAPTGENIKRELIEKSKIFQTEILMMTDTLKKMNSLLGPDHLISGRIFYVQKEYPVFLVIEDLATLGFRMADRQAGLDLSHCLLAMRGLARFHASSVAVCEKMRQKSTYFINDFVHALSVKLGNYNAYHKPQQFCARKWEFETRVARIKVHTCEMSAWRITKVQYPLLPFILGRVPTLGIFSRQHPPELTSFFTLGTKSLSKEIRKWPDLEKYAEKINKLSEKIYDKAAEISECREDEFNVINHGDFWVNNMMFRYNEEGKPIDHIFVDFQMCSYGSPANDLQYFLNTSMDNDVYENNKDMLLQEYLGTLSNMMKQFDCKTVPPNMEKLQKALLEREFLAMTSTFTILPLVLLDKNEAKDLDEIMGKDGNEYNSTAFENEIYRKVISERIPIYDQLGLLDL